LPEPADLPVGQHQVHPGARPVLVHWTVLQQLELAHVRLGGHPAAAAPHLLLRSASAHRRHRLGGLERVTAPMADGIAALPPRWWETVSAMTRPYLKTRGITLSALTEQLAALQALGIDAI